MDKSLELFLRKCQFQFSKKNLQASLEKNSGQISGAFPRRIIGEIPIKLFEEISVRIPVEILRKIHGIAELSSAETSGAILGRIPVKMA